VVVTESSFSKYLQYFQKTGSVSLEYFPDFTNLQDPINHKSSRMIFEIQALQIQRFPFK